MADGLARSGVVWTSGNTGVTTVPLRRPSLASAMALLTWMAPESHDPWLAATAKQPSGVVAMATGSLPTTRPLMPGASQSTSSRLAEADETLPPGMLATRTSPRADSTMNV